MRLPNHSSVRPSAPSYAHGFHPIPFLRRFLSSTTSPTAASLQHAVPHRPPLGSASFYLSPSHLITPTLSLFGQQWSRGSQQIKNTPKEATPLEVLGARDTDSRITTDGGGGGKLRKGAKLKCIVRRMVGNCVSVWWKRGEIKATKSRGAAGLGSSFLESSLSLFRAINWNKRQAKGGRGEGNFGGETKRSRLCR